MVDLNGKPKILTVEYDASNFKVLTKALHADYRVLFSAQPAKVFALAECEEPGHILLDVVMPEMDSYQVCQRLKRQEYL